MGCGPGRVTILLPRLGLDAFGIDLSPQMVALARQTYPELGFEVGSMLALQVSDASLGGLLAYYSIIHVPWERRPEVFAEFRRVLAPTATRPPRRAASSPGWVRCRYETCKTFTSYHLQSSLRNCDSVSTSRD